MPTEGSVGQKRSGKLLSRHCIATKLPSSLMYLYAGLADLLYEVRPGGFAVVDFKMDRDFGREIAEMARPYESQLRAYAEAVESATQCAVVECALVFSRLAKADPARAVHTWAF